MFSITEQTAKMHFTSRSQKEGDQRVPAATLSISFSAPNDILSEFDPDLKASLYRRPHPGEGDVADRADTRLDDPHYLPRLRFPKMQNNIVLEHKIVGAIVTIHHGLGGKSDLVMDECTVDAFKFDPQDGGTVIVTFNVACKPSGDQVSEIHGKQDQEITISIEPPQDKQGSLIESSPARRGRKPKAEPVSQPKDDPFAGSDLAADPDQRPEGWPFPQEPVAHVDGDEPAVNEEGDE